MPNTRGRKQAAVYSPQLHNVLFQQPPSWTQEFQTSEMHHPAAGIIGSRSVIHDVADIPQPIRIPFSCNGGEHSWKYRVGRIPSSTDCTLFKPCWKTIEIFFPL